MGKIVVASIALSSLLGGAPAGQEFRFELGQRLRALEIAWEERADPEARSRALPHLQAAVAQFFALRPAEAARSIDRARFALSADPPPAASAWAASLWLRPAGRFLDTSADGLDLRIEALYEPPEPAPDGSAFSAAIVDAGGRRIGSLRAPIREIPWEGRLTLEGPGEGDACLAAEIEAGGIRAALPPQTISFAARIAERSSSIEETLERMGQAGADTQRATIASHLATLSALARGETLETNVPAARLLQEAEAALAAASAGGSFFARRPGEYRLTLADEKGRIPARALAPEEAREGTPLPFVIALHGAGGSENLFFDGYGNGKLVRLCRARGWLLVAPRSGLFGLGPTADRIVEAVERLCRSIDRASPSSAIRWAPCRPSTGRRDRAFRSRRSPRSAARGGSSGRIA